MNINHYILCYFLVFSFEGNSLRKHSVCPGGFGIALFFTSILTVDEINRDLTNRDVENSILDKKFPSYEQTNYDGFSTQQVLIKNCFFSENSASISNSLAIIGFPFVKLINNSVVENYVHNKQLWNRWKNSHSILKEKTLKIRSINDTLTEVFDNLF